MEAKHFKNFFSSASVQYSAKLVKNVFFNILFKFRQSRKISRGVVGVGIKVGTLADFFVQVFEIFTEHKVSALSSKSSSCKNSLTLPSLFEGNIPTVSPG